MTSTENTEWPFSRLVFVVVLLAAYAAAAAVLIYPVWMYQLGK
jgi:hypothetical protein